MIGNEHVGCPGMTLENAVTLAVSPLPPGKDGDSVWTGRGQQALAATGPFPAHLSAQLQPGSCREAIPP